MATMEEIEQRRAERRAAHDEARAKQAAADLEAIDALEAERGEPLRTMSTAGYKAGSPVKIAFRTPNAGEYKRYCDTVGAAMQKGNAPERRKAQEQLAVTCLVYPAADSPLRAAMLEAFPGLLISLAIEAAKAAELEAEDTGKG